MKKFLPLTFLVLLSFLQFNNLAAQIVSTPGSLAALSSTYGSASAAASISITASGLTAGESITATAPAGFEVSLTISSGYAASVTFLADGTGAITNAVTVYVRLKANDNAGTYSGNIQLTSSSFPLPGTGINTGTTVAIASSTVAKLALTISGLSVDNKVYDGTTAAILSGTAALSGVISPDVVSLGGTGTAVFGDALAGNAKAVTVSGYTIGGADAANYTLTQPAGLTANINKRTITISGTTVATRVYDGTTAHGTITAGTVSGLVSGEHLTVTPSASPYYAAYIGTYVITVHYAVTDGAGGLAANYTGLGDDGVAAIISPKVLTISAPTIAPKVYDGTTACGTITLGTLSGLVSPEILTVSAVGVFPSANIGTQTATITYTLNDGPNYDKAFNYTLANGSASGIITAKPLTITGIIANDKVHDGNTSATLSGTAALSGVISADAANVTLVDAHTASFADANVGQAKPVTVSGYSISGSAAGNYSLTQPSCAANITAASGEIGNWVWLDADGNGVQDVGEVGIPGVIVQLLDGTGVTLLGTAVTDANGYYVFSHDGTATSTASAIYGISALLPGANYIIRIPDVTGANKQAAIGTNTLTVANTPGSNNTIADNDGVLVGVNADAAIATTGSGTNINNNFTYDFGFTGPGGVGGGGGGGLESKSLGDAVGNRIFNKAVNSLLGPVDYNKLPAVESSAIQNKIAGTGTSLTLTELLPKQIPGINYKPFTTTPADIPSITNAKDVLSIDYTLNNQARAVAFATKTQGEVYDHTKAICDRLKGSELLNIQNVTVNNIKLVRYDLKNTSGQTEYAISFAVGAKTGRANYTIQSNWLNSDYMIDEVMYNVQLWAQSPSLVMSMASDIITRLNASLPVKEVLSSNDIPKTYITKGKRDAENMVLSISNATATTNGYFEILEKANEQSTGVTTKQVPFTIAPNGKASVSIPASDTYESTLKMYLNGVLQDQVFIADGNWAANVKSGTSTIKSFTVANDSKLAVNKEDFVLFRNVQVEATTPDFVSLYKVLRGGGAPQDLSAFKSLQFTASGTGASLYITLVKDGITKWSDQYSLSLPLTAKSQDYKISLDDFTSTANKSKIAPNDITMVIFGLAVNSGKLTTVTADISKVSFSKTDPNYLSSLSSKELSVYPNPTNGSFTASFKSAKENSLTLSVTEASTGKVVFTKLVNAQTGTNTVPVNIDRKTGLSTYILSLEGAGIQYTPKKLLIEK